MCGHGSRVCEDGGGVIEIDNSGCVWEKTFERGFLFIGGADCISDDADEWRESQTCDNLRPFFFSTPIRIPLCARPTSVSIDAPGLALKAASRLKWKEDARQNLIVSHRRSVARNFAYRDILMIDHRLVIFQVCMIPFNR